jgi:hypothetical protein
MSIAFYTGGGVIAGIVLFFVLQYLGVIDAWISRLESLGKTRQGARRPPRSGPLDR